MRTNRRVDDNRRGLELDLMRLLLATVSSITSEWLLTVESTRRRTCDKLALRDPSFAIRFRRKLISILTCDY